MQQGITTDLLATHGCFLSPRAQRTSPNPYQAISYQGSKAQGQGKELLAGKEP